jgi:hypothetical protein
VKKQIAPFLGGWGLSVPEFRLDVAPRELADSLERGHPRTYEKKGGRGGNLAPKPRRPFQLPSSLGDLQLSQKLPLAPPPGDLNRFPVLSRWANKKEWPWVVQKKKKRAYTEKLGGTQKLPSGLGGETGPPATAPTVEMIDLVHEGIQ